MRDAGGADLAVAGCVWTERERALFLAGAGRGGGGDLGAKTALQAAQLCAVYAEAVAHELAHLPHRRRPPSARVASAAEIRQEEAAARAASAEDDAAFLAQHARRRHRSRIPPAESDALALFNVENALRVAHVNTPVQVHRSVFLELHAHLRAFITSLVAGIVENGAPAPVSRADVDFAVESTMPDFRNRTRTSLLDRVMRELPDDVDDWSATAALEDAWEEVHGEDIDVDDDREMDQGDEEGDDDEDEDEDEEDDEDGTTGERDLDGDDDDGDSAL